MLAYAHMFTFVLIVVLADGLLSIDKGYKIAEKEGFDTGAG